MGVSKNRGTPKSSILIGFSIINHPFWGTPIFGNTHLSEPKVFGRLTGSFMIGLLGWMSRVQEVDRSMVIGSMGYFTDPCTWGIPWGYFNHLLNIDPNFQRDIQADLS